MGYSFSLINNFYPYAQYFRFITIHIHTNHTTVIKYGPSCATLTSNRYHWPSTPTYSSTRTSPTRRHSCAPYSGSNCHRDN